MQRLLNQRGGKRGNWPALVVGAAVASLTVCGCANTWDKISSRDFKVSMLFTTPDPLVVLRDSTDGDQRAEALRSLKEPKKNGGSDADQETMVKILVTAAANERQALCRLAAIQAMAGFKDARIVQGLIEAYYRADTFNPETATLIRVQALTAMGETGNATAVDLLAKVVREPQLEGSETERLQAMDVRRAAARALSHFNHYQATEALVKVMQNEKDPALRNRAHESLQIATGKKLPPDAKAWDDLLHQNGNNEALAAKEKESPFKLMGFFSFGK